MAVLLVMVLAEEDRARVGDHFYLGPGRMAPVARHLPAFTCGEVVPFHRDAPTLAAVAEDSNRESFPGQWDSGCSPHLSSPLLMTVAGKAMPALLRSSRAIDRAWPEAIDQAYVTTAIIGLLLSAGGGLNTEDFVEVWIRWNVQAG